MRPGSGLLGFLIVSFAAVPSCSHTLPVQVRWKLEGQREADRNQAVDQLSSNMRNTLDIVGLIWFVIGHMWLLQKQE